MNWLNYSILVLILFVFGSSVLARAVDFYCAEYPLFPPVYSETKFIECKDSVVKKLRVCTQMAVCVVISEEDRKSIKSKTGKEYSELKGIEKSNYFTENTKSFDWLPSVLNCEGVENDTGQVVCPVPEKCMGDFSFNVKSAVMNQGEYDAIVARQRSEKPNGFSRTYESSGNGGKGK
ncbi:MAG: hypothetical protein KGP28_05505 [Bdellovibrionales bacterium]|nr:hypothetical protein [Bdellovibrionales bacterium]